MILTATNISKKIFVDSHARNWRNEFSQIRSHNFCYELISLVFLLMLISSITSPNLFSTPMYFIEITQLSRAMIIYFYF